MKTLRLPAPAKINLFLHILSRRPDGYHNIQTVFQFLDFYDVLNFKIRDDGVIALHSELQSVRPEDNLIVKAANKLQQKCNCPFGVDIELIKKLPIGGGVGGGSSDAATTLLALNVLWELKLSLKDLAEIAVTIGADVPVFIYGHAAWAEGIGEQLTPIILPEYWYLLLIPQCQTQTAKLYQDSRLARNSVSLSLHDFKVGDGSNDFETILRADYPEIARALDCLNKYTTGHVSGSGATVFAAFDTREEASRISECVPDEYVTIVAKGLNQSPLHQALGNFL